MHMIRQSETPTRTPKPVRIALGVIMGVLVAATAAGLAWLWPDRDTLPDRIPYLDSSASWAYGTVTEVDLEAEPITTGGTPGIVMVKVDGEDDEYPIHINPEVPATDFSPGDRVKLMNLPAAAQNGSPYVFADFVRHWPLIILALTFGVIVFAVARWKGLVAIVGLVLSLLVIWQFLLPALLTGKNPLLAGLVTSSAVMFIVVYLAHGISVKTTTALLGTFAGIAVVTMTAWWAIPAAHLTPRTHEGMSQMAYIAPAVDLRGVLLCGMVLAGVGVLNDVTITQASAVWELRAAEPMASRRQLFTRGMRIGRDHIASTVYTIAFAYVGTALALLILVNLYDHSVTDVLTFEEVAEELVRTLVASIGLVLAIPLTTAIGAAL
ncbi:MAG: YibE/F family protein, partial [Bifidobacteriaceae bacterium]|nr:YibE/F family protein [Bifidobacteriaceae bacterium]